MSNRHKIRIIIPDKIPERLWHSKDYDNIILYALEIYSPMYLQEFVNRPNITDKIPERTFHNHINKLNKKGYIESEINGMTRRRRYSITTEGERILKETLRNRQEVYGDLLSRIEGLKYFEKKRVFSEHYDRYLDICEMVENKFLNNIVDLTHFYPKDKFVKYKKLALKLEKEEISKRRLSRKFTRFIYHLRKYKKEVESDLIESESEIFYNEEMEKYNFHCPRCGKKCIIEFDKSFDCIICGLEFEKVSFKLIDEEDSILAEEEKKKFYDIFSDSPDKDESDNSQPKP